MTLIHESYHAGTKDWSEEKSYDYAYDKFYAMGDCLQ